MNHNTTHQARGILIDNLCKHVFVCGTPGSGKTTCIQSMLVQLHRRGIPFLVIEAAKTEYRLVKRLRACDEPAIASLAQSMQVLTPGVEQLSPLRLNPLRRLPGVDLDEHIDQLLRCFKASMPMFEPLPALLAEALELVYREHPEEDVPPTADHLYGAVRRAILRKRYSPSVNADLIAACEVRLGMPTRGTVGRTLRCCANTPDIGQLASSYALIELDRLEIEVKCLITLFLLTAINQYVCANPLRTVVPGAGPRLVIVIEEAHNIVGRSTDTPVGDNRADPRAYATELLGRMLAQFRALGVALILVTQSPSQVAPAVIKLTGTKLAFRQVDRDDRETLAAAMLFTDLDFEEIARFSPGQAFLYAEGYHCARRIRTPNIANVFGQACPPDRDELALLIADESWFREAAARRAADVLLRFRHEMDRCGKQLEQACAFLRDWTQRSTALPQMADSTRRLAIARKLTAEARRIADQITVAVARVQGGVCAEVRPQFALSGSNANQLEALRQRQLKEFDEEIVPRAGRLRKLIDRHLRRLQPYILHQEN